MQLEEGEIEDDSNDGLNPYTPLERPPVEHANICSYESETESIGKESSSDGSDDDLGPKRPKLRPKARPVRRRKYNIWCKDSNEQLTDVLTKFGMRNPENDRNVENYIVPGVIFDNDRKRKIPMRRNSADSEKLTPLIIDDLEKCEMNSFEELASDIAEKLSESNYELVLRIVIIIGKEKAIEFYNKTKEIEKSGGMLIANRSRRRTSGGVFILLVRTDKNIPKSQKSEIFEDSRLQSQERKNASRKKQRRRRHKEWLDKMNDGEKELESGQEELNNPPPSPEAQPVETLPPLPLRRDVVSYTPLNLGSPRRSVKHSENDSAADHDSEPDSAADRDAEPLSNDKIPMTDSPLKRDVVNYDDLCSMELIYD